MPTSKTASCFQLGVRFPDGSLQTTAATGGSLKVNGISVAAPNLIDSASVTFSVVGSNISLAASGTVTSFSASTLSPLFTTSVATATTTPALTFSLSNAAGGTVFGNNITGAAGPAFTIAPVLGIPGTSTGSIALASSTASGKFTITAPASTSTPTLTLPITSNVLAGQFAGDGVIFNSILNTASAAGTLTPTLLTQTAYYVLAGPGTAGPAATPTFRALVAGDIPPLSGLYLPLAGGTMTGVLTLEASAAGLKDAAGSAGATGNLLTINASGYPIWTAPATSGTVTSFSAGNLSPLFTTSVATATTTPALTFALSNAAAGTVLGNATGSAAGPGYTATPVLGLNTSVAGTLGLATSVAAGATITLQNLGALTAYNFNLPLAVGATGSVLTSQAGGSSAMTWTTQAGLAVAWSSFVAATASLTLNNAAYTTTFNQTSAANWTWANTTVATSITTNASPLLEVAANYWTGAASAADTWTIGSSLVAGTNGASTLTIAHTGSTGNACVLIPTGVVGSGGVCGLGLGINTVGLAASGNTLYLKAGTTGQFGTINFQLADLGANNLSITRNSTGPTIQFYGSDASAACLAIAGEVTTGAFPSITLCNNIVGSGSFTGTSGAQGIVFIGGNTLGQSNGGTFAPTSGNATFYGLQIAPVINQTGSASGSYTALKIAATETALLGTANKLIDCYAGAAGTTQVFAVDNLGAMYLAKAAAGAPTSVGTAGTIGQIVRYGGVLYFCSVTGAAGSATWNSLNMTAV